MRREASTSQPRYLDKKCARSSDDIIIVDRTIVLAPPSAAVSATGSIATAGFPTTIPSTAAASAAAATAAAVPTTTATAVPTALKYGP